MNERAVHERRGNYIPERMSILDVSDHAQARCSSLVSLALVLSALAISCGDRPERDADPGYGLSDAGHSDVSLPCDECWPEGFEECHESRSGRRCVRGDYGCLHWDEHVYCMGPFRYCGYIDHQVMCVYQAPPVGPDSCPYDGVERCDGALLQRCEGVTWIDDTPYPGTFMTVVDCATLGMECFVRPQGPICGEPCDPLSGTGCEDGERCTFLDMGGDFDAFGCVPHDPAIADPPAGPCSLVVDERGRGYDTCGPGYQCASPWPWGRDELICLRVTDQDCTGCDQAYPDETGDRMVAGHCDQVRCFPIVGCNLICQDCADGQECVRIRLSRGSPGDICKFWHEREDGPGCVSRKARVGGECIDVCSLTGPLDCPFDGCNGYREECIAAGEHEYDGLLPVEDGIGICSPAH